jgi:hypothetical protein
MKEERIYNFSKKRERKKKKRLIKMEEEEKEKRIKEGEWGYALNE